MHRGPSITTPNMNRRRSLPLFARAQGAPTRVNHSNWTTLGTVDGRPQPVPPPSAVKDRSRVVAGSGKSCRVSLGMSFWGRPIRSLNRIMAVSTAARILADLGLLIKPKRVNEQTRMDRGLSQKGQTGHHHSHHLGHQRLWHPVRSHHGITRI